MKANLYTKTGEKSGSVNLKIQIFGVKELNQTLIHQAVVSQMSNKRRPTAHTKDRSERRGGGKKPWRQKGTGRARHGSIRSPIWRGGGVTFGPRNEKNYSRKINKKAKKLALTQILSQKLKDKRIVILEGADFQKTKEVALFLDKLKIKSALIFGNGFLRVSRNIKGVKVVKNLNLVDLLSYKFLVADKETIINFSE